jgi:hypothetical protein
MLRDSSALTGNGTHTRRERGGRRRLVVALAAALALPALASRPAAAGISPVPPRCDFLVKTAGRFNRVRSQGNLGANDPGGSIRIGRGAFMADGTVLAGDIASVGNDSSVFDVAANQLSRGRGVVVRGTRGAPVLPLTNPFCPVPTFACGGPTVVLPRHGSQSLPPGGYGDLMLRDDGVLTLTGGTYEICSLWAGKRVRIRVTGSGQTVINVAGSVRIANGSALVAEPGTPLPILNIGGTVVRLGADAVIEAFMSAPQATLSMGRQARILGSFCVRQAVTDKGIRLDCASTTTTTTTTSTTSSTTTSTAPITTSTSTSTTTSTTTTTRPTTTTTKAPTTTTSTTAPIATSTTTTTTGGGVTTTSTTLPLPPPDHYLCYRTSGRQEFVVTLEDQFDSGTYRTFHKKVMGFCTPADKSGEGIQDPDTHLKVYRLKGPHAPRTNVEVTNQFGTYRYDTFSTETLMVPAAKSLPPAPPPPAPDPATHDVDHFRCVRVRPNASSPAFVLRNVTVVDQFGSRLVTVTRATKLCVPADKNGEGIKNPEGHLLCYKAVAAPTSRAKYAQVTDQFGSELLKLRGEQELCVPSTKRLP